MVLGLVEFGCVGVFRLGRVGVWLMEVLGLREGGIDRAKAILNENSTLPNMILLAYNSSCSDSSSLFE
jgi:hypothetical protein